MDTIDRMVVVDIVCATVNYSLRRRRNLVPVYHVFSSAIVATQLGLKYGDSTLRQPQYGAVMNTKYTRACQSIPASVIAYRAPNNINEKLSIAAILDLLFLVPQIISTLDSLFLPQH